MVRLDRYQVVIHSATISNSLRKDPSSKLHRTLKMLCLDESKVQDAILLTAVDRSSAVTVKWFSEAARCVGFGEMMGLNRGLFTSTMSGKIAVQRVHT